MLLRWNRPRGWQKVLSPSWLASCFKIARSASQWLAAASVVDIPVAPWEDLMTLTILDLYETEKTAHLEAPTVQREVPWMGQREF
jgi:hypothetical protein